jgi:hypothetical protein
MRPCRQWLRLVSLAVALLFTLPSPLVLAKGSGESPVAGFERAKGTVALNLGHYDEAIEHLSQAYTLTQDPGLLFTLGQAYRLAGKPEKALAAYSAFLRAVGSAPKYRAQLERAAAEIEAVTSLVLNRPGDRPSDSLMTTPGAGRDLAPPPVQNDKVAESAPAAVEPPPLALAPPPPPSPPPPGLSLSTQADTPTQPPPSRIYSKWWFWTSVAVAVAAGGTAAWYFTRSENQAPGSTYGTLKVLQ